MPFKFGPWELTLIVLVILIIFGAGKLPTVFKEIGRGVRSLRHDVENKDNEADN